MSTIAIENMHFFAHHGCFEEETIIGTRFRVDLFIEADTGAAEKSDNLEDTLDYQSAFLIVKEQMTTPSKLLEHVGKRILDALFAEFPEAEHIRLKIYKLNPPVGGEVGSVSVELERSAER